MPWISTACLIAKMVTNMVSSYYEFTSGGSELRYRALRGPNCAAAHAARSLPHSVAAVVLPPDRLGYRRPASEENWDREEYILDQRTVAWPKHHYHLRRTLVLLNKKARRWRAFLHISQHLSTNKACHRGACSGTHRDDQKNNRRFTSRVHEMPDDRLAQPGEQIRAEIHDASCCSGPLVPYQIGAQSPE